MHMFLFSVYISACVFSLLYFSLPCTFLPNENSKPLLLGFFFLLFLIFAISPLPWRRDAVFTRLHDAFIPGYMLSARRCWHSRYTSHHTTLWQRRINNWSPLPLQSQIRRQTIGVPISCPARVLIISSAREYWRVLVRSTIINGQERHLEMLKVLCLYAAAPMNCSSPAFGSRCSGIFRLSNLFFLGIQVTRLWVFRCLVYELVWRPVYEIFRCSGVLFIRCWDVQTNDDIGVLRRLSKILAMSRSFESRGYKAITWSLIPRPSPRSYAELRALAFYIEISSQREREGWGERVRGGEREDCPCSGVAH